MCTKGENRVCLAGQDRERPCQISQIPATVVVGMGRCLGRWVGAVDQPGRRLEMWLTYWMDIKGLLN